MGTFFEEFRVRVEREESSDRIVSIRYEDSAGRLHRTFGDPAFELYDPISGRLLERKFAEHGEEHRLGGEASYQVFAPQTGHVTFERWAVRNLPPENGVSAIERDDGGNITRIVRRKDGQQFIDTYTSTSEVDTGEPSP